MSHEITSDWRELAADLPADQASALARMEANLIAAGTEPAEVVALMLDYARHAVTSRTLGAPYADVPISAGANVTGDWEPDTGGGWSRGLSWRAFGDARISVDVNGLL
jgi:hypothetical protein